MENLLKIIYKLFNTFSFEFVLIMTLSGIFVIVRDSRELKKQNLQKDYKIARFLGYSYMLLGIGLYFVSKIIK